MKNPALARLQKSVRAAIAPLTVAALAMTAGLRIEPARGSTLELVCEGFGRAILIRTDGETLTVQDFRDSVAIGAPLEYRIEAFSDLSRRLVGSRADFTNDPAIGLLTVIEVDFTAGSARETRFNLSFENKSSWRWPSCR